MDFSTTTFGSQPTRCWLMDYHPRNLQLVKGTDRESRKMPLMKNPVNRYRLAFLAIAVLFGSESSFTRTRSNSPACSAPVKWMVPPKFTEGAIAKWKDKELTGTVSLVVSEGGDIIQRRIRSVKPKEAAQAFLSAVQQGKFQPRPGCGDWKLEVTFRLHPD